MEATPNEELKGTSLGASKSPEASELDSLIAETLSESKIKLSPESPQKEKAAFAATPISKEYAPAPKKPEEIKKELPRIVPAPQTQQKKPAEAAVKEAPKDQYDQTLRAYTIGDIVKGTVASVDQTGALIDIQYKSDGYVSSEELSDKKLNVGDKVDVYILSLSNKEGNVELSIKQAEIELSWNALYDSFKYKKAVEASVTSAVGGGLVVDFKGIRGFVPASQVSKKAETPLTQFVGTTVPVKVIEIDRRRSKVIMSHRLGNADRQLLEREKNFEQMEVGQVLKGNVSSIKKFGVFVNINGVEGLIHVNDLSWKRVDDPSRLVSIGQELEVFVMGIDKQAKKVSLGLKQLQPDPWANISEKYRAGQTVSVKVLRIAKFGAFAELEEGVEGLIHNTELSSKPFQNVSEVVKPGDTVKARILRVIEDEQKIGLSIREAEMEEQKAQMKQATEASAPQKITIGDAIGDELKEQLSNKQDELSQPS